MVNTAINRHPVGSPALRARMAQARRERTIRIIAELLDSAAALLGLAGMFAIFTLVIVTL